MPITAKLSQKFYDKLGDDVANELVEWFNKVDATYRADLRELNELNFARFDAKLEQRLAELGSELRRELAELRAEVHGELAGLRAEFRSGIAELRGEFRGELHGVHGALANVKAELVKWMFLFWVGTALTVVGLLRF